MKFRRVYSELFKAVNDLKDQYNSHRQFTAEEEAEMALDALANLAEPPFIYESMDVPTTKILYEYSIRDIRKMEDSEFIKHAVKVTMDIAEDDRCTQKKTEKKP
jgi:hypothetical protein